MYDEEEDEDYEYEEDLLPKANPKDNLISNFINF